MLKRIKEWITDWVIGPAIEGEADGLEYAYGDDPYENIDGPPWEGPCPGACGGDSCVGLYAYVYEDDTKTCPSFHCVTCNELWPWCCGGSEERVCIKCQELARQDASPELPKCRRSPERQPQALQL